LHWSYVGHYLLSVVFVVGLHDIFEIVMLDTFHYTGMFEIIINVHYTTL